MDKKFKRFTENMNSSVPFFPYILETHTIILKKIYRRGNARYSDVWHSDLTV